MFDMFGMLGKLGEVKNKIQAVKDSLPGIMLEENELNGTVIISISADKKIHAIKTSDAFYNEYTNEEREALLLEAINNAIVQAEARYKSEISKNLEGLVPNIPGLDIGSLLGA